MGSFSLQGDLQRFGDRGGWLRRRGHCARLSYCRPFWFWQAGTLEGPIFFANLFGRYPLGFEPLEKLHDVILFAGARQVVLPGKTDRAVAASFHARAAQTAFGEI